MVTNYYVNKVIKFLKNQLVFDVIVSIVLMKFITIIITPVIAMESFTFKLPEDLIKNKSIVIENEYLKNFKLYYYIITFLFLLFIVNDIYERFLKDIFNKDRLVKTHDILIPKYIYDKDKFQYILGLKHKEDSLDFVDNPKWISIPEEGLFQNVLCIGTIGQGKTIAELVVALLQMMYYAYDDPDKKVAMLCLDVKGNFYKFVHGFAKEVGRWDDVITIELGGKWKYNPVHKPNLSPIELANRMRYILELFSTSGNESYWIDKAEDTITELIKLIRLYNREYVDFEEIHLCGSDDKYRTQKIEIVQAAFDAGALNEEQKYSFISLRNYFYNEFDKLDTKAQGFIKSEITRITQPFISTKLVKETFCPKRDEINFYGFEDVIAKGKIVVWKINANKEPKIAKLVAAYLKLDNQKEIMITMEGKNPISANRKKVTICDEYQEYVTVNDAEFMSQSREPKSVTFATTQSYSSLKKSLKNEVVTDMLLQNFVNKIWLRTDDEWTVKKIMTQTGKEEKEKVSTTITESSRQSRASFSIGKILGKGKNLSSGISVQNVKENRFDEYFLMQLLDAYKCVAFLSDGKKIKRPSVVHLTPFFEGRIILKDGQVIYTDDNELIFRSIGEVDIEKLEEETVKELKDSELIDSSKELLTGYINSEKEKNIIFHDDTIVEKDIAIEELKEKGIPKHDNNIEKEDASVINEGNVERKKQEPERNMFDGII